MPQGEKCGENVRRAGQEAGDKPTSPQRQGIQRVRVEMGCSRKVGASEGLPIPGRRLREGFPKPEVQEVVGYYQQDFEETKDRVDGAAPVKDVAGDSPKLEAPFLLIIAGQKLV